MDLFDSTKISEMQEAALDDTTVLDQTYNPQDPALRSKMIEEAELQYLKTLVKGNSEKFEQQEFLNNVHSKASFTAKVLTQEMIEGKAPISYLLE